MRLCQSYDPCGYAKVMTPDLLSPNKNYLQEMLATCVTGKWWLLLFVKNACQSPEKDSSQKLLEMKWECLWKQLVNCLSVTPTMGNANENHNETPAPTMLADIKAFANMVWARVWRRNIPCMSGGTGDCQNSHVEQGGTTHQNVRHPCPLIHQFCCWE